MEMVEPESKLQLHEYIVIYTNYKRKIIPLLSQNVKNDVHISKYS